MRRYLKEADAVAGSDVDAVDPSVLRGARAQLHQGVGALELVGLPTAAQVLRASEAALQKLTGRPVKLDAAAVETIEQASFALLDYLARQLAGKAVSPLALFPQYRAVQELAGADRVHPADLWRDGWQWRHVPGDARAEWEFLHDLVHNVTGQNGFVTIEGLFNQMAKEVPAFSGLTWASLGDTGVTVQI